MDAADCAELNDKTTFSELCEEKGILVPKSFPITTKERLYELNNTWVIFDTPAMFQGCIPCIKGLGLTLTLSPGG